MTNKVIKTACAAILAMSLGTQASAALNSDTPKGMEKCYGIAKAGMNDCGTKANKNACAGSSTVDGDKSAYMLLPKGTCLKIVGASTKSS